MLKVYGASASPFVRKVLLTLEYKGLAYEAVQFSPFSPPAGWEELSPLKKIPVLVDGDVALPDSTIICRYLEDVHPAPPLYPASAADRARACWLEEFADTVFASAVAAFFFERFAKVHLLKQQPDEARLAKVQAEDLPGPLAYLERTLPHGGYLFGDALSIADIAIVSPMINGLLAGCPIDATRNPKLMSYFQRITALPLFKARAEKEAQDVQRMLG